jgi:hypothetical protein
VARDAPARHGLLAFWLTVAAFGWSLALVVGAFVVPVYSGSGASTISGSFSTNVTLVAQNGLAVLLPVAVPAGLTLFVWIALHRKCSRNSRVAGVAASAAIAVLAAFNTLALFSIGIFIMPVTLLLVWAACLTRGSRLPRAGPRSCRASSASPVERRCGVLGRRRAKPLGPTAHA